MTSNGRAQHAEFAPAQGGDLGVCSSAQTVGQRQRDAEEEQEREGGRGLRLRRQQQQQRRQVFRISSWFEIGPARSAARAKITRMNEAEAEGRVTAATATQRRRRRRQQRSRRRRRLEGHFRPKFDREGSRKGCVSRSEARRSADAGHVAAAAAAVDQGEGQGRGPRRESGCPEVRWRSEEARARERSGAALTELRESQQGQRGMQQHSKSQGKLCFRER